MTTSVQASNSLETMGIVSCQLLRALRGARSQAAWARRLGYRGNPVTDWEHGRNFPSAEVALHAAERAGVDVARALRSFDPSASEAGNASSAAFLRALCARKSKSELAAQLGCSRSAVSRWASGNSKPRLPEFLALVDAVSGRVQDLVGLLVPINEVPALAERHASAEAARRLAFEAPWTEAILRVLETDAYAELATHSSAWVANYLGLAEETCERGLTLLAQAGLVQQSNTQWQPVYGLTVDTRGGKQALRALKSHWAKVAAQRATAPQAQDHFAYNVVSVSDEDYQRIRELLRSTYRDIRAIVSASRPSQRVALLNLQLLSWHEPDAAQ